MAEPFLGELKMMSFAFPPKGWSTCSGQTLPIAQFQALFSMLGTMYGGNGQTTFRLPDLRGRTPVHAGSDFTQGEATGSESVTINIQQLPTHIHGLLASAQAPNTPVQDNGLLAAANNAYADPASGGFTTVSSGTVSSVGGSQAHNNMQPYLVINWCIALTGIFPTRPQQ